jgi:prophage DNA circulation protein
MSFFDLIPTLPDTLPSLIRPLWTLALQTASWQKLTFFVTETTPTEGRRLVVHEYPLRDTPWVEDLGRANQIIPMQGYLVGDDVIAQRDKFKLACSKSGQGTLVHPSLGTITDAVLVSASFSERVEEGRMISLDLSFIRSGKVVYPALYPITSNSSQAISKNAAGGLLTGGGFLSTVKGLIGKVAGIVGTISRFAGFALAAVSIAKSVLGVTKGLGAGLPSGTSLGRYNGNLTLANPAITGLSPTPATAYIDAATTVALATATTAKTAVVTAIATCTTTAIVADATFVAAVFNLTESIRISVIDPADQINALVPLANFQSNLSVPGTSPINTGIDIVGNATAALCRRAALTSIAQATAIYQPTSSTETQTLINRIAPLYDTEITYSADNGDLQSYTALRALRTAVVDDLQLRGSQLPTLITWKVPTSLPSLVLAYNLYRDVSRSDDLINRANPPNPVFCPTSFIAESV